MKDGRTDKQTDTAWRHNPRLRKASRGKSGPNYRPIGLRGLILAAQRAAKEMSNSEDAVCEVFFFTTQLLSYDVMRVTDGTVWSAPAAVASSRHVSWSVELLAMSSTTSTASLASCVVASCVQATTCTCCLTAALSAAMIGSVVLRRPSSSTMKLTVWNSFIHWLVHSLIHSFIHHMRSLKWWQHAQIQDIVKKYNIWKYKCQSHNIYE